MCKLRIAKIRAVKTPARGTSWAAGTDFYIPEFDGEFIADFLIRNRKAVDGNMIYVDVKAQTVIMAPRANIKIPSGIKADLMSINNAKVKLEGANKSSVSTEKGLIVTAGTVDSDYQGEIHICLNNSSNTMQYLKPGDKIAQFVLVPVLVPKEIVIEDEANLYSNESERGDQGFGSTGKD